VKPDINPGKVHPQLIGNGHLVYVVDGALVGAGSLQQIFPRPGQLEPASGSVSCTCDVNQQPWGGEHLLKQCSGTDRYWSGISLAVLGSS
jgi:hypothetical protein